MGRSIVKVAARAFAHPTSPGGGNPVTVFLSSSSASPLPASVQAELAKSFEWESVVAQLPSPAGKEKGLTPLFRFFMPSGEEVSFCAHAAIGAAAVVAAETEPTSTQTKVDFHTGEGDRQSVSVSNAEGELLMEAQLEESIAGDFLALGKIRESLGLRMEDISLGGEEGLPSYINSSVARPKTLLPMSDLNRLHAARNPPDAEKFKALCDKIGSTGIYLYCPCKAPETLDDVCENGGANEKVEKDDGMGTFKLFECRQFPRFSGYPEDPATGIAAAALAASLQKRGIGTGAYEFIQGTAMGRKSRIGIRFGCSDDGSVDTEKIYCSGLVEILSKEDTCV
eukprot:CAMPEP_0183294562 /NCGR_PEP_ID=MMETSP0160_2-20130417/2856_1 /TAXON_ID=2839 ORGANISM="Odontella Sinensis, Strain Grunow 1884" /NCGR_SAMPLE_ID=MMETSP0160_2 /ASSEMBLY_ACC=CAM_ASM_000250 /LENGTH=338 /DNA_ID=CAMNT_0025455911 /DNA_START=93 /DNA_END=1109 /DNA_ORIENTATION=-